MNIEWSVMEDPGDGDQFPIRIQVNSIHMMVDRVPPFSTKKYNPNLANWTTYQNIISHNIKNQEIPILEPFQKHIKLAASAAIPLKTSNKLSKYKMH
ncbi:hypothetical protein HHI36_012982 [Cryptolaemus montrouzieri]|uniref:Uncharacterized protein n=1 Tax=Cryptolaemus montrouzieri TaxID=559131 RepID=A0ABD2NG14_9CUCU